MYQFDVVTLFPEMFDAVPQSGVTGRARERKLFELVLWNPRDFAANSYRTVDDRPYGGGPGMVMMVEPLEKALDAARRRHKSVGAKSSSRSTAYKSVRWCGITTSRYGSRSCPVKFNVSEGGFYG